MTFHAPGTYDDLDNWSSEKLTVELNLPMPEIDVEGEMLPDFYRVWLSTHDRIGGRLLARALTAAACRIYEHIDFWGDHAPGDLDDDESEEV